MRVLLAGATGAIGRATYDLLREAGHDVRCLVRRPNPDFGTDIVVGDALNPTSLEGAADRIEVVVSSIGASVGLKMAGRATYARVDVPANRNLIVEAERAGVGRFVYLGVHTGPGYDHTRYVRAHEDVCELLAASPMSSTTIRPVGVFTALDEFVSMARRGKAHVFGDGSAKTNPIHPLDVAQNVVRNVAEGPEDVSVGGPEVLTRRQIAEIAFEALGKSPRIGSVPPGLVHAMVPLMRPFHPRMADLVEFAVAVSTLDCVAPVAGSRRLADYFSELAG